MQVSEPEFKIKEQEERKKILFLKALYVIGKRDNYNADLAII